VSLREAWEGQAANWVRWAREPGHDSYWQFHREPFLSLVPPPGRLTLDIGCGEGRVTRDLRALGHRAIGVDSAPSLVRAARDADPDGEYVEADASRLPFADGAVDLVVASMSLMDMDDMPAAVREIGRVLAPGGRLCAAVVHPINAAGTFQIDGRFKIESYLDRRVVVDEIEREGLQMTFHGRHLILEDYSRAFEQAGLLWERSREIYDDAHANWCRVPLFLDVVALKA
jgi:ubiquinone/menaquinone biosynthesis C-methylase UbiE